MRFEPRDTAVHQVDQLESPVEILVDRWGISHVYASSPDDAFFAQGFNAARDRLWQIDLWRRRGLGLLSEVFGSDFVAKDRAARLFLYRGDMRSEWLAYGSDTKRVATAFVAGINEYVRLTEEDSDLLPEPDETLTDLMLSTLGEAFERPEETCGQDPDAWGWGDLHQAYLPHPLSPILDEESRERLGVGPATRGGSGDTVGNTAYSLEDFRQTGGSSWRLVVDIGAWDDSLAMNSPGQSGGPGSPHYDDLFPAWASDGAFPLLYSREKVEAAPERRIVLEPQDGRSAP